MNAEPQLTHRVTVVRPARRHQASAVSDMIRRAYAEYAGNFPWPDAWEAYCESLVDVAGRWGGSRILVGQREGEIIGSVDYHAPGGRMYSNAETTELIAPGDRPNVELEPAWAAVRCLAVHPDHRGTGAGRALMYDVLRRARLDGATLILLHSVPTMASAIGLYEDLGFVRRPDRDFRLAGGGPAAVLAYQLELRGA